ncbi:MAG TPA: cytochrome c maturation protein CcmE [Candidatus Thermoplasmatota archaeon]|nr:cytochrome c maturation protein CcmE [Candidatus Thermoplasmatota archaeon]
MRRRARLALLLTLAAAGGALAFAGALPSGYATVGDVVAGAVEHQGEVTVKAAVLEGSVQRDADPVRFVLTDGASRISVVWDRTLPEHEAGGSLEGRTVVVTGTVTERDGEMVLVATDMQVGCASKYERG